MPATKFILLQLLLTGLFSSCHSVTEHSATDSVPRVSYARLDLKKDTTLFMPPREIGVMDDSDLSESSGLAPSHRNPGYLWTEEDSGNSNQIQLIRPDGSIVARFYVDGAENRDWEDIAVGPGPVPGETYIYLADIGDNQLRYPEKIIYRFPEPTIAGQKFPFVGHVTHPDTIRLQLPNGPQNAEAILVDPITKDLFILSKGDRTELYRATFPQSLTQPTMMTPLLLLPFENVTAGAISTDGQYLLIRMYAQLFYYTRQSGETIPDALKRAPRLVPLGKEAQGEAVSWSLDGTAYYTGTEKTFLTAQSIYVYQRKK
ncbi:hypothetical protein GO730_36340 [Spirosoma sp. HMF3257]|uniref:PE-PGRS family protein n=1 Tax=Spirosoma telluris TaxID=2183553 RepID=A0A327NS19_9BACT|nr:hypothetical protein [Spirosoma telluris]RAI78191.1 hypothetical protein HMF3257_36260 [Spirosoma telluris]